MATGRRWRHNLAMGLFGLTLLAAAGAPALADDPNRAALIVAHGSGQTLTRCVSFSEPEITGYDLLQRSGLDLNVDAGSGMGVAVCRIDQEGCTFPTEACFCQCQGSPCVYWSYWRLTDGDWRYSSMGASNVAVRNGDVEGWVWSAGTTSNASPPPVIPFDQICLAPTPIPPTSTPPPTATYTVGPPPAVYVPPTATDTPRPTSTTAPLAVATATGAPTLLPAATSAPSPAPATPQPTATFGPAILTTPTRAQGAGAEAGAGSAIPPAAEPTTQATDTPFAATRTPRPVVVAQVAPTATPRPTRSGATATPILALSQGTPTPQPIDASPAPGSNLLLIGAIVVVGAGAAGLTLLALKRAK